jgi:aminopeptidase N
MWLKVLIASALFVGIFGGPQHFDGEFEEEEISPFAPTDPEGYSFRLPNNSIPLDYNVLITTGIHIPDFSFTGRVLIRFRTLEASSNITINFKQLTIHQVHLFDGNHIQVENFVNFEVNHFTELMVVRPSMLLPANTEFVLRVDYNGTMRTDSYGYYRGVYLDENGNQRWFGATQFQATDARHAFPCYDEPQFRTTFTIQIRNHQSYHALGNRPIVSISPPDNEGYITTTFQEIPSMHTYLVAFTVSDFIFIENSTVVPPQRVYGRRQRILHGDGDFALEVSPAIMKTCEDYYGMKYTFPKMDQGGREILKFYQKFKFNS